MSAKAEVPPLLLRNQFLGLTRLNHSWKKFEDLTALSPGRPQVMSPEMSYPWARHEPSQGQHGQAGLSCYPKSGSQVCDASPGPAGTGQGGLLPEVQFFLSSFKTGRIPERRAAPRAAGSRAGCVLWEDPWSLGWGPAAAPPPCCVFVWSFWASSRSKVCIALVTELLECTERLKEKVVS